MSNICVYTVAEVANLLKVSSKTVYKLVHNNEMSHIMVRGQIRIPSTALAEFLQRGDIYCANQSPEQSTKEKNIITQESITM